MTKKHFIALAAAIREHNKLRQVIVGGSSDKFSDAQLETLAEFCATQNPRFGRISWLDYIARKAT